MEKIPEDACRRFWYSRLEHRRGHAPRLQQIPHMHALDAQVEIGEHGIALGGGGRLDRREVERVRAIHVDDDVHEQERAHVHAIMTS